MPRELAIRVSGVSKEFRLPHEKAGSVKSLFINMFRGHRTYERQKVLKNISFDVHKGEFLGIVGRNGGGKSTLLKLLAGIYAPNNGAIEINGKLTPFIELGVGFNPELTGRENVYLNGALLGFDRKEMDAIYPQIVEFAELGNFMDQKLKNYSSGMQVRLAFSVAIQAKTDILLIDEVLAVGDANFQKKCFDVFDTFKQEGRTVIFISHSMQQVKRFCDRVLLISNGEIVAEGEPYVVTSQYEFINDEKLQKRAGNLIVENSYEADLISRLSAYISPREKIACFGNASTRDLNLIESFGFQVQRVEAGSKTKFSLKRKDSPSALILLDSAVPSPAAYYKNIIEELDKGALSKVRRIYLRIPFYLYVSFVNKNNYKERKTKGHYTTSLEIARMLKAHNFEMIDSRVSGVDPGCQYVDAIFDKFDNEKKELLWGYLGSAKRG